MGSVADLYTTGDNDPEIEPVQYYRHYLYCDACGSFQLDPWIEPEDHEKLEERRRWLGRAAAFAAVLLLVAAWEALDLVLAPALFILLITGVSAAILFRLLIESVDPRGWPDNANQAADPRIGRTWRFVRTALLWLVMVAIAQGLAGELSFVLWAVAAAGLVLLVAALVWRHLLGSRIESVGRRCRQCGERYRHGSRFFTNLDANPHQLTVADVPRPLGSSCFEIGKRLGKAPPAATSPRWNRLPQ